DKHRPPSAGSSHGNHAVLVVRVLRVWRDAGSVHEQCLNLHDGNAMLLALRTVAAVPVKSLHPQIHHSMKLCKCIYKCQEQFSGGICHRGRLRAPEWCPASPDKRCGRGKPLTDPRQPIFLSTYTLRFRLILKTWWPGKELNRRRQAFQGRRQRYARFHVIEFDKEKHKTSVVRHVRAQRG